MAKDIKINLNGLKNLSGKLMKNLGWLFFAVFLIILVFEVLEIQTSFSVMLNVNQQPQVAGTEKGIRINFADYQKAVDRISNASSFVPAGGVAQNPFGVQVTLQPQP